MKYLGNGWSIVSEFMILIVCGGGQRSPDVKHLNIDIHEGGQVLHICILQINNHFKSKSQKIMEPSALFCSVVLTFASSLTDSLCQPDPLSIDFCVVSFSTCFLPLIENYLYQCCLTDDGCLFEGEGYSCPAIPHPCISEPCWPPCCGEKVEPDSKKKGVCSSSSQ